MPARRRRAAPHLDEIGAYRWPMGNPGNRRLRLRPRFKDQIEGRLRCPAEACEPAAGDHFAQALLSRLRAKRQTYFLGQRGWRAQQRGGSVECASDGMQIVFELVAGKRLDDHPSAVLL